MDARMQAVSAVIWPGDSAARCQSDRSGLAFLAHQNWKHHSGRRDTKSLGSRHPIRAASEVNPSRELERSRNEKRCYGRQIVGSLFLQRDCQIRRAPV
jgi:hypothetical protein